MTPAELAALGKARHGHPWIKPLAKELGFHFSTIWRATRSDKAVSREIEQAVKLLPRRKARRLTSQQQPQGDTHD